MIDKTNDISIANTTLDMIPKKAFEEYQSWVHLDHLSPSAALDKFMEKHQCLNPDSAIVIHLIKYAYPEIDTSRNNFTFKIHDSGYPYVQENLNDKGFDELVEEMRSLSDGW